MANVTFTVNFTVLPQVTPGDGAKSFTGVTKAGIAVPPAALTSQAIGVSLSDQGTGGTTSSENWHGLSLGTSVPSLLSKDNLQKISNVIKTLKTASALLVKIAKLIEMVISSFGSLGQILNTILNIVQGQVNTWIKDLQGVGLYFNMIVPPAYLLMNKDYKKLKINEMASGGFPNFLSTLGASFYNSADKNRPVFSDEAAMTGFIILVDSDTLDQFFTTMLTFTRLFNFMDLLPINMMPAPPKNIKGVLKYDKKKNAYGVSLTWKGPATYVPEYKISRSKSPGGIAGKATVDLMTLKLYSTTKDQWDLFKAIKYFLMIKDPTTQKHTFKLPQVDVRYYNDIDFDGPQIVAADPLSGGGSFTDYNIKLGADGRPVRATYHYVIQGGLGAEVGLWGAMSSDIPVHISPPCLSPDDAAVVMHQDPKPSASGAARGRNRVSLISSGWAGFNRWSNVKLSMPFLDKFAVMFNQLLDTMKGMTANVNTSFLKFIESIADKITYYASLIEALIGIVQALESLKFSGRVGYLYLPLKAGGVPGFMSRLRAAKPLSYYDPATKQTVSGFSGPSGITAGMVFVTGLPAYDNSVTSELSDELNAAEALIANTAGTVNPAFKKKIDDLYTKEYNKAMAAKTAAFNTLVKIFTGIFGG
jgi:hypothetical protein